MALDGAVDQGIPASRMVTDAAQAVEDPVSTAAYRRSACATRRIDAYLVTGKLPATGTACPAETS